MFLHARVYLMQHHRNTWGLWRQRQVSRAQISNCVPHNTVGAITYTCPKYISLESPHIILAVYMEGISPGFLNGLPHQYPAITMISSYIMTWFGVGTFPVLVCIQHVIWLYNSTYICMKTGVVILLWSWNCHHSLIYDCCLVEASWGYMASS